MKKNKSLQTAICEEYCAYFKPGKNEELVCGGYAAAERLMQAGAVTRSRCGAGREFDRMLAEPLVTVLCAACDFQEDGCDFMLDRTAPPCGGFVLLAQLLETGELSLELLRNINLKIP